MTGDCSGSAVSRWREIWRGAAPAARRRPSAPHPSSSSTTAALSAPIARCAVAMRAAERLVDDPVDNAQRLEVGRGDPHRFRRIGRLVGGPPQDRRAAFGRDHRIDRMLEHQHAVGRGDRDRAARSALADDHRDQRHLQRQGISRSTGRSLRPGRALRPRRPGKAPGVSTRVTTGSPKRSASCIRRIALR